MSKQTVKWFALALTVFMLDGFYVQASDHDDGVTAAKEKNLNLTDLYVFREDNQTGRSQDSKNLILVMNSNPRAVGGQQEHFNERGLYEFHIGRVRSQDKNKMPDGEADMILRMEFGQPDANQRQSINVTMKTDEWSQLVAAEGGDGQLLTTSRADALAGNVRENKVKVGNHEISIFAGLREDPFFFDVDQFFQVRAGAAGLGPKVGFRPADQAVDFTVGYNVNSIVVRVPIALLQGKNRERTFDVWEIVKIK